VIALKAKKEDIPETARYFFPAVRERRS